jgi:YbbR domain-containing protein
MVNIFPNPANNYLIVAGCEGAEITITGLEGRVVKKFRATNENFHLDISNIKTGTYLMLINLKSIKTYKKLVVVR